MKLTCERGCLTCEYAKISDRIYIDCTYPMPNPLPACMRYKQPTISFERNGEYEDPDTARAYICHDEYYDEGYIADCPTWKKRKRPIPKKVILAACDCAPEDTLKGATNEG